MSASEESLTETLRARRRRRALRRAAAGAVVVVLLLILAYALAGIGVGGGETKPIETGVRGTVWRRAPGGGPASSAGTPIAALVQVRDGRGKALGSVTSSVEGDFSVELPPGSYVLVAVSPVDTALPVSEPVRVVVREGEVATAHLVLPASSGPALAATDVPLP